MPIFLTTEQIHGLLDIAARCSPRDHALFRLAANTGLRESDILRIRRVEILTGTGEVVKSLVVRMRKTRKRIDRVLTDPTREAIALHLRTAPASPWLFPGELPDQPLSRRTLHRIYKRHLKTLLGECSNLTGSSTHTLRRSLAFEISQRAGVQSASVWLGHTSLQNTLIYLDRHRLQENANKLIDELNI